MSKINIDGVILDEQQQKSLSGHIESLIYSFERVDIESDTQKKILEENVKGDLKLKPKYVKDVAKKLYALKIGKLNASEDQDAEAAKEQIMEIYDKFSSVSLNKNTP